MKNTIYKDLIPLYKMGAEYLLALRVDISTGKKLIDDCLVLQTNTNGTFSDKPWSLQKHMKFNGAYYDPIPIKSWTETQRKIFKNFTPETINKIEQLLLDPPQESVKSLIFIPPRLLDKTIKPESLIKDYIENYNEYLDSTIEYPDEADDDFYAFLESEKLILEYFGLRQEKKLNQFLYYFVQDSCHEKKIKYSKHLTEKIKNTMIKIKHIAQHEAKFGKFFETKLKEIIKSPLLDRDKLPNFPGIFVFYKYGEPIYVGRADNIKTSIQYHTRLGSQSGIATYAFNLTKQDYEKKYGNTNLYRKDLEKNEDFKKLFISRKKHLSECQYRVLEEENDILQSMLEPYFAYKLGTYPHKNTFENH